MGICDLLPFLRKQVPSAFQAQEPGSSQSVAVDVPLVAHKFACIDGTTAYLESRFDSFLKKLSNDGFTKIVMVFDGAKTPLKDRERQMRQTQRQKNESRVEDIQMIVENSDFGKQPTKSDQDRLRAFFVSRGIQIKEAKFEAEACVAHLVRSHECEVALTEDSDALAFLCPKTLIHFNKVDATVIHLDIVLEELKMTSDDFQLFCILCGCDFLQRLPLVGPAKLLSLHSKTCLNLETAHAACKDVSFKEKHQQLFPEVLSFFQTCANEM